MEKVYLCGMKTERQIAAAAAAMLISNVHMGWMRAVAGRLKSDYRYSASIV